MIIIQKIKKHFSETFATENREKGLGITGAIVIGTLVVGSVAWLLKNTVTGFYTNLIAGFGTLLLSIGNGCVGLAGGFLTYVTSPTFTNSQIVEDPVFNSAWASVRDLSNMLIVLGFVVVGIATTLRFKDYEAKKLLPALIGVALLINFSGLMCQTIINGADLTTTALLQQGGGAGGFATLTAALTSWGKKQSDKLDAMGGTVAAGDKANTYLAKAVIACVFLLFAAYIFAVLAVLLAARYAVLAIFYILSPIAFVAFVFPATKSQFQRWWSEFIKWSIMGVLTAFFIYMAMNVIIRGAGGGQLDQKVLFVGLIFLYIGYKMARSGSAEGSAAILGMAIGGARLASGAVGKVAMTGTSALANSRAGQATKRGLARVGEKIGAIAPGTSNLMKQESYQKGSTEKRSQFWTAEQRKKGATSRSAITRTGRNDQTKMAQDMILKNEMNGLSDQERDTVVSRATADGTTLGSLMAKGGDYRAAASGKTGAAARTAKNIQLSQSMPNMTGDQLRNISVDDVDRTKNPDSFNILRDSLSASKIKHFRTAKDAKLITNLKDHLGPTSGSDKNTFYGALKDAKARGDAREMTAIQKQIDELETLP